MATQVNQSLPDVAVDVFSVRATDIKSHIVVQLEDGRQLRHPIALDHETAVEAAARFYRRHVVNGYRVHLDEWIEVKGA